MLQPANRIRTRSTTKTYPGTCFYNNALHDRTVTITNPEEIQDRVTPKRLRRFNMVNALSHSKTSHSLTNWKDHQCSKSTGLPTGVWNDNGWCFPGFNHPGTFTPAIIPYSEASKGVTLTPPSIADILSKVTNPEKNNLGVDIAELLTAGGAIAGIAEMFNPSTILELALEVSRMSARGIAKQAISLHLQAIYGYLPFFDSLMKLVFSLAHFDYWANNLGKSQKVTFKRIYNRERIPWEAGYDNSSGVLKYVGEYTYSVVQRFHATVYFTRPSLNPIEKFLLFLDYVDLSVDASDVWAVVPCSFVIDWFLPVSDALRDFDNFASASFWEIGETYVTTKTKFSSSLNGPVENTYPGGQYSVTEKQGSWTSSVSSFSRCDWMPRISSFKGVSLPNGWQTLSMAELAGAMFL